MGSISALRLPRSEVQLDDEQTLTVRGLSVFDLSEIIREHAGVLDGLYKSHIIAGEEMPSTATMAQALMMEAPDVVARIIARANDEPESWEIVSTLPGIVQIDALVEIAALTFRSEAEVKKLLETLIQGSTILSRLFKTVGDRSLPKV